MLIRMKKKYQKRSRVSYVKRYCLYCGKEIPKRVCLKFYYLLEYCSRKCKTSATKIEKVCDCCSSKFNVSPRKKDETKCPTCRKYIKKGAKPCAYCNKLMFYYSPLVFGNKEYCCISCMVNDLGNKIRYCVKCKYPLSCSNGSMDYYHKRTTHKNCKLFKHYIDNMKTYDI